MSRIAYVNGRYVPLRDAVVNVEDRGYQFSDGVYEVCEVRGGKLVDERRHMERLARSLSELRIPMPMPANALSVVLHETVRRNRVRQCRAPAHRRLRRGSGPLPPIFRRIAAARSWSPVTSSRQPFISSRVR